MALAKNRYLFETTRFTPFTVRRVQQIVQAYRQKAGITRLVHPHLFRHQILTFLTTRGLSDSQIQLISGHSSKKSLENLSTLVTRKCSESLSGCREDDQRVNHGVSASRTIFTNGRTSTLLGVT